MLSGVVFTQRYIRTIIGLFRFVMQLVKEVLIVLVHINLAVYSLVHLVFQGFSVRIGLGHTLLGRLYNWSQKGKINRCSLLFVPYCPNWACTSRYSYFTCLYGLYY